MDVLQKCVTGYMCPELYLSAYYFYEPSNIKGQVNIQLIRLLTIIASCMLMACFTQHQVGAITRTVVIYQSDGSRQCEPESGISLSEMGKSLIDAGIQVLSSHRDHDCFFRPALCGSGTSFKNVYKIEESRLSAAQELTYIPAGTVRASPMNQYQDSVVQ